MGWSFYTAKGEEKHAAFPASADVSFAGYKATLLGTPTNSQDAATKGYVDTLAMPVSATPPASPFDGQEYYLQSTQMESLGAIWHMRYRPGASSIYKWEFVGGAPWRSSNYAQRASFSTGSVTTWVNLTTGSVTPFAVPRDGDYMLTGRMWFSPNVANGAFAVVIMRDGFAYGTALTQGQHDSTANQSMLNFSGIVNAAAGSTLGVMGATNNIAVNFAATGQSNFDVIPLRLA